VKFNILAECLLYWLQSYQTDGSVTSLQWRIKRFSLTVSVFLFPLLVCLFRLFVCLLSLNDKSSWTWCRWSSSRSCCRSSSREIQKSSTTKTPSAKCIQWTTSISKASLVEPKFHYCDFPVTSAKSPRHARWFVRDVADFPVHSLWQDTIRDVRDVRDFRPAIYL